jgi:undecaprenyl-diphosphatase
MNRRPPRWLLVVGTIPAGLLGLALEHALRSVFASPTSAPAGCASATP